MIALKKVYGDELLRIALVLSLLGGDPRQYLYREDRLRAGLSSSNGSRILEGSILSRPSYIHPKSLDVTLLEYEREVFAELNSLGAYTSRQRRSDADTFCVNNFIECRAAQVLPNGETPQDGPESGAFDVSDDDNVAGEVALDDTDDLTAQNEQKTEEKQSETACAAPEPTLLNDPFDIDAKSFDVSDFFATPIKKEAATEDVKIEPFDYLDIDLDQKYPQDSVFDQNLSDLRDYAETAESLDRFRRDLENIDVKKRDNLEQYLLDNTQIELDKYGGFSFELGIKRERASTSFTSSATSSGVGDMDIKTEPGDSTGDELTQEDMDLIEVLWKQDVDLGFTLETPTALTQVEDPKVATAKESCDKLPPTSDEFADELKFLKYQLINDACGDGEESETTLTEVKKNEEDPSNDDPWAGLSYTIDTETGEYIIQGDLPSDLVGGNDADADRFDLLEEALQLVGLDNPVATVPLDTLPKTEDDSDNDPEPAKVPEPVNVDLGPPSRGDVMLHPGVGVGIASRPHHPHHSHHPLHQHYHHQRWQDLASLLAISPPEGQHLNLNHHPHHLNHLNHLNHTHQPYHHHAYGGGVPGHHPYTAQHGAAPPSHLGSSGGPYPGGYGTTLAAPPTADKPDLYGGSVVDHQHTPQSIASYKNGVSGGGPGVPHHHEPPPSTLHDPASLYYQNSTADINGTSDGFLSSILDEDLQLMDMAVNEGMYTMRMLDGSGSQQLQSGIASGGATAPPSLIPTSIQQYGHSHHGYNNLAPNVGPNTQLSMGNERIDSSSDSAVSSMGSERVPSLSDGEWCDGGSDSAQEYHSSKFRPYSGYGRSGNDGHTTANIGPQSAQVQPPRHHTPPVAQKKHHMFGKRCFQEQPSSIMDHTSDVQPSRGNDVKYEYEPSQMPYSQQQDLGVAMPSAELKYSCTLEFAASSRQGPMSTLPSLGLSAQADRSRIAHNHTYGAPPEHAGGPPLRPQARDKRARRLTDASDCSGSGGSSSGSHLSRDEKRAKALGIPIAVQEIINLPMDEFNERLSKHDLSEAQLSLIRDIRRRGKNKVAAQNCRKRKLEQITSLEDEVRTVRDRKTRLQRERIALTAERQRVKDRFTMLYHHVFQHLRDTEGNPLSSHQYSLQQAADGAVVLVPRAQQGHNNGNHQVQPTQGLRQSNEEDRHMNRTTDDEIDRYKSKQQRKSFDQ